jgi:hypothetical protein
MFCGCGCVWSFRKCIAHYIPKYIDVTLSSIKYSFEGCCEMEMDLFDAAVRRFQEIDNMFYERMCVRWRHFFESDFMVKNSSSFSVI